MLKTVAKSSKGDTILEVLISLTILAFVLLGAYYIANQSLRSDRDAQEHTEALTIAESQLEQLRSIGTSFNTSNKCVYSSPNTGCYVSSNDQTTMSATCPTGTNAPPYCYSVLITEPSTTSIPIGTNATVNLNTYEIQVSWPALGETTTDNVYLYYRLDD